MRERVEHDLIEGIEWIRLGIEAIGAVVVLIGIAIALFIFVRHFLQRDEERDFRAVRITLAHYLGVALEFQLAADILSTAVAPTWERIGKLAAVAVIRTGLNYFLNRELREFDRRQLPSGMGESR